MATNNMNIPFVFQTRHSAETCHELEEVHGKFFMDDCLVEGDSLQEFPKFYVSKELPDFEYKRNFVDAV
jgi:hypothetical protein